MRYATPQRDWQVNILQERRTAMPGAEGETARCWQTLLATRRLPGVCLPCFARHSGIKIISGFGLVNDFLGGAAKKN
jgi:hypothetical protein